ncbi:hypothetical protein HYDPIDRAFT_168681 [Hydnomerulius pinastri MD-312]|uniref:Rhodopsin domain-containing protein n=1 Tax=Hydnomerulius pinastri MD-312 TaxID=994086 RepID=A0A0C9VXU5_9AGAM|nr:hypothetical protein HYDPIDRAFT_168681 [Hydnomerulius pinastri MD-312]
MPDSLLPGPVGVSVLLVLSTVFHGLAVILTSFRLWFRYHIRRLWWDDFWAALSLCCDFVCMVVLWTLTAPTENPYISFESLPILAESRDAHVLSYWLNVIFYTCSIWFARLSIIFSVVRIVPPTRSIHLVAFSAGGIFVLMWAYILSAKSITCSMDKSWYNDVIIQCPIPKWVALSEVTTDAVSDVMLVALPLRLLWRVKLPSNQRIMILCVFSASILTSVLSAIHTAYIIPQSSFVGGVTAEFEGAVSLIVCNLLVIVTFIYRRFRGGRDLTQDIPPTSKLTRSSNRLTTIDLDFSGSSLSNSGIALTGTGFTGTGFTGTGFTGTGLSGTGYSGLAYSSVSDKETFGSIISTGGSVLPTVTVSTDPGSAPVVRTKQ